MLSKGSETKDAVLAGSSAGLLHAQQVPLHLHCRHLAEQSAWAAQAFAGIADQTREDVYLHPHVRYYVREVRVVAYSQVGTAFDNRCMCLAML